MKHEYKVEEVCIPSITNPNTNEYLFQITYAKNGAKEKPMILHSEEYAFAMIQEFIRYHPTARVVFKAEGGTTPISLMTLEQKVERLRAEMEKGIYPSPMDFNITTTPTFEGVP